MRRGKAITLVCLLAILGVMGTLTAYSVELYEVFCRVTGYGGTTQVASEAPEHLGKRQITVRFDANTAGGMPWRFSPAQRQVSVLTGQETLAFYVASNPSDRRITGTATFNVTPLKAGQYFNKIDCFCFTEQTLDPGQVADLPVQFFIDPAIVDDPNLDDVTTITLSYTFFKAPGSSADKDQMAAPREAAFPNASIADGQKAVN